jgi:hypothetical protein
MREKILAVSPPWPSAETMFLRPGQRVDLILLRGGAGLTYHSFYRDDQKIFKKTDLEKF